MSPLRKRGAVYWLDVSVAGKRHRVSLGTDQYYPAIDKAREIERQLGREAKTGPVVTLENIASKYREWARTAHPATAPEEASRLRWILDALATDGVTLLSQVTSFHVETLRGRLRDMGRRKSTVNRYAQILRGLFYRAIEWGDWHGENPLRRVRFYPEERNLRPLTLAETEKIMAAARAISADAKSPLQRAFADLCEFAMNTGMRKSEILTLKWKDIRAREAIVRGKGDKQRAVPLNKTTRAVIDRQDKERGGEGAEYIFDVPNRNQPDLFRRTTMQVSKAAGVPFHFHLLRHAFASLLLARGVDIVTISSILGHSKTMVTLLYSHTNPEQKRRAVEALDAGGRDCRPVTRRKDTRDTSGNPA